MTPRACQPTAAHLAGLTALLLAAACTPQAPACHPHVVATWPMHRAFTLAAQIDGRPSNLLLDTGSYESILTTEAVTRLGLHTDHLLDDVEVPDGFALRGVGGRRHYDLAMVPVLDLPGVHRLGVPFASLWSGYAPWGVDGVLGMALLGEYDLDLQPDQVTLYEPGTACVAGFTPLKLLQRPAPGAPTATATLDGRPVVALLDTGAEHSILFAPAAWRPPKSGRPILAGGVGPDSIAASLYQANTLRIGDIALQNMQLIAVDQVRPSDAALILGTDFFRRVHVILSQARDTAWLQFPVPHQ